MSTLLCHEAFHEDVGHAFNELILMDQIEKLPPAFRAELLQSFPFLQPQDRPIAAGEAPGMPGLQSPSFGRLTPSR